MRRRHQQMIVKQTTAFDAEGLLQEIRREQKPLIATPEIAASTPTEQPLTTPRNLVVGRQVADRTLLTELSEYLRSQSGVSYRPFVPTLLYATRSLLEQSFLTPDYETPARTRLAAVHESDARSAIGIGLSLGSLVTQFHKGTGLVSLAVSFEASDEKTYLYAERRQVIGAYSPEGQTRHVRQPVMLDIGRLSLRGPMRRHFDPAELHLNVPLPAQVELEPVDVVNLREPTKLL